MAKELYSFPVSLVSKYEFACKLSTRFPNVLYMNGFVLTNEIAVLTIDNVKGLPIENRHPHITVSCAEGIKPFYSNKVLETFTPVDISEQKFVLHGVLYFHEWKKVRTEPPDASERFPKQGSA
mgnify:CR=1 FL=1